MSVDAIRVAVVGHTNTGKTSMLRTLTRDVAFGEVSPHPAVTRHVEGAALLVNGQAIIELYDTPGLEDSISLLDHLDDLVRTAGDRRPDWTAVIGGFLDSPEAHGRFVQEAKALRQLLKSEIALYVIDVRDRVLGKHRDELEILSRCARPVVPVLNFTASPDAKTAEWRQHLARVNMHAVAEFDTVVVDEDGERRLFEKMQTMLDTHRKPLQRLIDDRARYRQRLAAAASGLLAELLLDVAAYMVLVPASQQTRAETEGAMASMQEAVRGREAQCVRQLLELYSFRVDDGRLEDLPLEDGQWGLDLFSPEAMKQFGVRAGGAAAAGAMAGLALDAMTAGITMGAFTATGAAIGALYQTGRSYGKRLIDRARGMTELRCNDATLKLLMSRQLALVHALMRRGHAAVDPVRINSSTGHTPGATGTRSVPVPADGSTQLFPELLKARANPKWSGLTDLDGVTDAADAPPRAVHAPRVPDPALEAAQRSLSKQLEERLTSAATTPR